MNGQILRMNKQHEQNLFMFNNEWINLFILQGWIFLGFLTIRPTPADGLMKFVHTYFLSVYTLPY